MDDLDARVTALESVVAKLGQKVLDQQNEIDRLKAEVSMVQTERAIESLSPWPRRADRKEHTRVTTLDAVLANSG